MKRILAVDPGTTESAFVLLHGLQILTAQIVDNETMLKAIKEPVRMMGSHAEGLDAMVVEMVEGLGMPVGKETFETVFWIGRFCQASMVPFHRVYRKAVKLCICGNHSAKDSNIRQALLDKLGLQGTKKKPGPTYGVSKHMWAALAVGVTWQEQLANQPVEQKELCD